MFVFEYLIYILSMFNSARLGSARLVLVEEKTELEIEVTLFKGTFSNIS